MRKNKSKADVYNKIIQSNAKSLTLPNFNKKLKSLPKLTNREPNFLRIGCPTECLIHIPHYVAVLNEKSKHNLATSNFSINDVINHSATKRLQQIAKPVEKIANIFESLNVPITSFAEIKLPTNYFNLDSVKHKEEQEIQLRIQEKLKKTNFLKPLSVETKKISEKLLENAKFRFDSPRSPYLQDPRDFM